MRPGRRGPSTRRRSIASTRCWPTGRTPCFTSTPSGDLLDTARPLTGVRSVSYSASDAGGGLYQADARWSTGAPASTQLVDDNGGRCRQPFLSPVPCKNSASGTLSFDTAALPDGQHTSGSS